MTQRRLNARLRSGVLACSIALSLTTGCDRSAFEVPVPEVPDADAAAPGGATGGASGTDGGASPSIVPPMTSALALVSGRAFSCARKGEVLGCWGDPLIQQALGVVDDKPIGGANFVVGGFSLVPSLRVRDVSAEGDRVCLVEDGRVLCTQRVDPDPNGLPVGCSSPDRCLYQLHDVGALPEPVLAVDTSEDHACAIAASGRVVCWGRNDHGQLGPREATGQEPVCAGGAGLCFPPAYVDGLSDVVQVSVSSWKGWGTSCALTKIGQIYCWGAGNLGQLAGPPVNDARPPTPLPLEARFISVGPTGACAVGLDGRVLCWGSIDSGLNLPTQNGPRAVSRLTEITAGGAVDLSGIVQVSRGLNHACAVDANGRVWCWGNNNHGELGRGRAGAFDMICQVDGMAGLCAFEASRVEGLDRVTAVATGRAHTCATRKDGTLWCWGSNSDGQVGRPVKNPEDARNFTGAVQVQGSRL